MTKLLKQTLVTARYGVVTVLEEDVYQLVVMSKFYYWNDFCDSMGGCDLHVVFHRVHELPGKIIGQIGHECSTLF